MFSRFLLDQVCISKRVTGFSSLSPLFLTFYLLPFSLFLFSSPPSLTFTTNIFFTTVTLSQYFLLFNSRKQKWTEHHYILHGDNYSLINFGNDRLTGTYSSYSVIHASDRFNTKRERGKNWWVRFRVKQHVAFNASRLTKLCKKKNINPMFSHI